jgi:hypothetical protein
VWWDTDGIPFDITTKLFTGLDKNSSNLLVSRQNLESNYTYKMVVYASIDGFTSFKSFTFTTVSRITQGQFSIDKTSGLFFEDTFTVTINGWTQPGGPYVEFDLYTYYEIFDATAEKFEQKQLLAVFTSQNETNQPISDSFKFPLANATRIQYIELEAYTSTDIVETRIAVQLNFSNNTDSIKAELQAMNMDTVTNAYDITVTASAIMYIYDVSVNEKIAIKAFLKIAQNYAILVNATETYCPNDLYCQNRGSCSIDSATSIRICACDGGYKGYRCELITANFDIVFVMC